MLRFAEWVRRQVPCLRLQPDYRFRPRGGGFNSYRGERIAASHTEPGLVNVLGTALRAEHGVSFLLLFFHTLRLGPRQPNLLRNMSRRREFPCERERGLAVVAHPLTSATKRCHPIKETAPTRSRAGQVNRLKLGSPLSRCAKSRVFCNFCRSGRLSEATKSKTAPVLASSEPKRGLFRASTSW